MRINAMIIAISLRFIGIIETSWQTLQTSGWNVNTLSRKNHQWQILHLFYWFILLTLFLLNRQFYHKITFIIYTKSIYCRYFILFIEPNTQWFCTNEIFLWNVIYRNIFVLFFNQKNIKIKIFNFNYVIEIILCILISFDSSLLSIFTIHFLK